MSDLIDRQAVIDEIENLDWYHVSETGKLVFGSSSEYESLYKANDIYKAIENIPSAEPERKKGKWIETGKKIYKCSECGNYLDFSGVNAGRGNANFCPECGADMTGGEDENVG